MKLTKVHREAFVKAVLQDAPQVNYEEQAHKFAKECAIEYLPAQLRQFALSENTQDYLSMETIWFNQHFTGICPVRVFASRNKSFAFKADDRKKLDKIEKLAQAQIEQRQALKERVAGVIASCTTLKIAKERLPEFAKYLPEEIEKTQNLPAIANIVADLTKLGWPKDKPPVTA